MTPDELLRAETQGWLEKAYEDLQSAQVLMAADLIAPALFHCQQAVEKALKAFLTWHSVRFRKSHDIEELGAACIAVDSSLANVVKTAEPLTSYAWKLRYPGEPYFAEIEEATEVREIADAVYRGVVSRIQQAPNS